MTETTPLLSANSNIGIRKVRSFLICLTVLFSLPYAASTIAVYDILYSTACGYYSIPADQCLNAPQSTQFVASLFSVVSILNAVLATIVLVITTIWSDRKGGRERGLVWFMAMCAIAVITIPLLAYGIDSKKVTPWRMLVPYIFFALSGTPTLLLNLSMLHVTDLVPEPRTRIKSLSLLIGFAMLTQAFAPGLGSAVIRSGIPLYIYMSVCGIWMALGTFVFAINLSNPEEAHSTAEGEVLTETALASDGTIAAEGIFNSGEGNTLSPVANLLARLGIMDFLKVMQSRNAIIVTLNFILSNELAIGIMDLIMVYGKRSFGWESTKVGGTQFMLFGVRMLWALLGFPFLYSKITNIWAPHPEEVDGADLLHMILCNFITTMAYAVMASASTSSQYTAGVFLLANDGIVGTVWINSLIKHVSPERKGAFMGALSLINKPLSAILPAVFMKILQYTTETRPSTVLWVISGIALALTLSLGLITTSRPTSVI